MIRVKNEIHTYGVYRGKGNCNYWHKGPYIFGCSKWCPKQGGQKTEKKPNNIE